MFDRRCPTTAARPHSGRRTVAARGLLWAFLLTAGCAGQGTRVAAPAEGANAATRAASAEPLPNVVVVFADDHGYADWGEAARRQGFRTPNLDRLAAEGVYLDNFYVAQAVCSASRAALLTGSYPNRVGVTSALDHASAVALNPDEVTVPELLKARGYATAIVGKWHLGARPEHLPLRQGFDEFFGLPYSNDMWPHHPSTPTYYPPLPLYEGERVIERNPDQSQLTARYAGRAVDFIRRNRDRPFFLYLAHSMPHVPLHVSDTFRGRTGRGLYGDVIEELDWSVGQVLDALRDAGIDDRTLVVFASDNGPWRPYGDHAGSAGALRGEKGTAFEGGVRVPFLARWPGRLPAGKVVHAPAMAIDLLPTLARLAGAQPPVDRVIDGRDIWPLLAGSTDASPHEALYFYWGSGLHAVRSGRWKLHLPHPYRHTVSVGHGGKPGPTEEREIGLSLYDLDADPGERHNLADRHPDVVARLQRVTEQARAELGDSLTGREGRDLRPPAKVNPPAPGAGR